MESFTTHLNTTVTGEPLVRACARVANDLIDNAYAILKENAYAPHVTEERKQENLNKQIAWAEEVRRGKIDSFTTWQRVNTELTGECVALLSK